MPSVFFRLFLLVLMAIRIHRLIKSLVAKVRLYRLWLMSEVLRLWLSPIRIDLLSILRVDRLPKTVYLMWLPAEKRLRRLSIKLRLWLSPVLVRWLLIELSIRLLTKTSTESRVSLEITSVHFILGFLREMRF